jgi:capsular polysaccharide biosynthesis protein
MFQQAKETSYLESTSLLVRAFKWRRPLIIITSIAAISSFIFSGPAFITPKYLSTVVFFPPATNSISKALLEDHGSEKQDILAFGTEEQAEQMLQILNSDGIRDAVVRKYNLLEHYGIDAAGEYPMTQLCEEYRDNISFSRTEFMSVRIAVLDKDPQMAADIANDIGRLMDSTRNAIRRDRALEAAAIVEKAYTEKLNAVSKLEDSLAMIRSKGIIDYASQAKVWNEEYAKSFATLNNEKAALKVLEQYHSGNTSDTSIINTRARIEGASSRLSAMQQKIGLLAQYGGAATSIPEQLELDRLELSHLREQLNKVKVDTEQQLSSKFIVNKASKAEKKSTPVRWLIVLSVTISAFFLSFLGLLFIQRLRNLEI